MKKYGFSRLEDKYYYDGFLGARLSGDKTEFAVWAPLAESMTVNLYSDCDVKEPFLKAGMANDSGVWKYTSDKSLDGVYYTYTAEYEGKKQETIDIYARSCGTNGHRGMIFNSCDTNPEGWENEKHIDFKNKTDAVLYELHVRDFSTDDSGNFRHRGKFLAFTEDNVKSVNGDTVGLQYIKELGATHIHLLPIADYASVDEGSTTPQFNWGYDPLNYNIPEGSYSTNPADGRVRVNELKQLVMAAHKKGLGIIMDVVYNHTYHTFDSPFFKIFPYYYYRSFKGKLSNGSACGNEFASDRKMASRFICDSLCYLAREYKLDGFRFDLMGLLDIETINTAAERLKEINPDIILYGEGWTGGDSPLPAEKRAIKVNAGEMPAMSMFSDDFRDGVKGSVFIDTNTGYINGSAEQFRERMKSAMAGGVYHPDINRKREECWTDNPAQSVNYVEAHDNLTFMDKLSVSMPTADFEIRKQVNKLGAALVFLSQGVCFIQAGQEMLRTKYDTKTHSFIHDSYKSPDSINSIKWGSVSENADVLEYYKGLIGIRKAFPEFRLKSGEEIRERLHFANLDKGGIKADIGEFTLYINPAEEGLDIELCGEYQVFADSERANAEPLYDLIPSDHRYSMPPKSVLLIKGK